MRVRPSIQIQEEVGKIPTIHNVHILDASGSMEGSKYNVSKEGILKEIEELKKDTSVNWTYSLVEFVESRKVVTHQMLGKFPNGVSFNGAHGGDTPLYFTVFDTITKLLQSVKSTDKVLIKVYTDGGNNTKHEYTSKCAELVKKVNSENFTVTFVATPEDLERIMRDINVDKSNTLGITNDKVGFEKAFTVSLSATRSYSKSVLEGEDVSVGFYSKTVNQ